MSTMNVMGISVRAIDVRLTLGGMVICPPGSGVMPRVLRDFEFVWIIEGNVTWTCDDKVHSVTGDTLILVRPGMHDSFRWDPVNPTRVAYLHFDVVQGLDDLPPQDDWPMMTRLQQDDVIAPLFRQIVQLVESQPPGWYDVAGSAASHLLLSFITATHAVRTAKGSDLPEAVERALAHVSGHWHEREVYENVPLEDLCRAAAVSPRHLSRLFQETFGSGPVETLRLARLEIAADLLRHTDYPLARIAHATGFANAFHLSRAFKSVYGLPPGRFRSRPTWGPSRSRRLGEAKRLIGRLLPRALA